MNLKQLVMELKKANIPFEYGPLKLKQGYGEAIIYVLQNLIDKSLKSMGFSFLKPIHRQDEYIDNQEILM